MSEIGIEYKRIIQEIEAKISNEEEKDFVKSKVAELSISFIDIIDRITKITESKIKEIEKTQTTIEKKMSSIENIVDNIESDIYEDSDEDYEFEVVCPYCNHEFSVDIDGTQSDEIECPECHNIIELDWNEEQISCSGSCSHCEGNCVQEDEETYNNDNEKNKDTKKNENNEDDM